MKDIPDGLIRTILKKNNTRLLNSLGLIRSNVIPILEDSKHKHFTKHNIDHMDRVYDKVNLLIAMLRVSLCEEEAYILAAATYLHDIGMQSNKYEDPIIIRKEHHKLTYEMIIGSIKEPSIYVNLGIESDYASYIALIAKGHRKIDLFDPEYNDIEMGSNTVRLRLLSAVLRFADELDIDSRRVDFERMKIEIDMSEESKLHWYKHYYVQGVTITDGLIKITYRFPKEYFETETAKNIQSLVEEHIKTEYELFKDKIFWPSGIHITHGKANIRYDTIVSPLPEKIIEFLNNINRPLIFPDSLSNWTSLITFCGSGVRTIIEDKINIKYIRDLFVERENIYNSFENFLKTDKHKVFILSGFPGCGKTNVMCDLAEKYLPSIFIDSNEEVPTKIQIESIIRKHFNLEDDLNIDSFFKKIDKLCKPQEKSFIIFIDGFFTNETLSDKGIEITNFIEPFVNLRIKVVLSCRTYSATPSITGKLKLFTYSSLFGVTSESGISFYLNNYTEKEYIEAIDRYLRYFKIRINKGIEGEAKTRLTYPYLLRLFSETYNGTIQEGPIRDIRYIELCNDYWFKVYKKINNKFLSITLFQIEEMFMKLVRKIREDGLEKRIIDSYYSFFPNDVMIFLIDEGIFYNIVNNENNSFYSFSFPEFQEFLMAKQILKEYEIESTDIDLALSNIQIILNDVYKLMYNFNYGLIEFAILLLENKRNDNLFIKILEKIINTNNTIWQKMVLRCIPKLNNINSDIYNIMVNISKSNDEKVIITLSESLGMIAKKHPEFSKDLLFKIMQNFSENIRIEVVKSLFRFDGAYLDEIIIKLNTILVDDHRWRFRSSIATAISNIVLSNMKNMIQLIEILIENGSSDTLTITANSIAKIGESLMPDSLSLLEKIINQSKDDSSKEAAIQAFASLANFNLPIVTEKLLRYAKSNDISVRIFVARNVNKVEENLAHRIWEDLSKDKNISVRMEVFRMLDLLELKPDPGIITGTAVYNRFVNFDFVVKKNQTRQKFEINKIAASIYNAAKIVGGRNFSLSEELAHIVVNRLAENFPQFSEIPSLEINNMVERVLQEKGHRKTYNEYLKWRIQKYGEELPDNQ